MQKGSVGFVLSSWTMDDATLGSFIHGSKRSCLKMQKKQNIIWTPGIPPGAQSNFADLFYLHAGQPINADGAAGGVAPELDELLDGEDTSEVLDGSAVFSMASLESSVRRRISGDPSDVGDTDDVAVQVGLEDTSAA